MLHLQRSLHLWQFSDNLIFMKGKRQKIPLGYSMTKAILDLLIDFGEHSVFFEDPLRRIWRSNRGIPAPKRWRYKRAMDYLESVQQIELETRNDRLFIKLTQKGKLRALLHRLDKDFKQRQKWDGKWRLIMWDIPEDSKQQRNRIRALIKNLGFYQLQKSVFVTPFPLPASAVEYLRESDLLQFIRFVRADQFDDDSALKRHYKL